MRWLPSLVCCLSTDHISKTEQDRLLVTVEHCIEVGTIDFAATFTSTPNMLPNMKRAH